MTAPLDREAIRQRAEKAAVGEWQVLRSDKDARVQLYCRTPKGDMVLLAHFTFPESDDAKFCMEAHNRMPALLSALDAADAEIAELKTQVKALENSLTSLDSEHGTAALRAEHERLRQLVARLNDRADYCHDMDCPAADADPSDPPAIWAMCKCEDGPLEKAAHEALQPPAPSAGEKT